MTDTIKFKTENEAYKCFLAMHDISQAIKEDRIYHFTRDKDTIKFGIETREEQEQRVARLKAIDDWASAKPSIDWFDVMRTSFITLFFCLLGLVIAVIIRAIMWVLWK